MALATHVYIGEVKSIKVLNADCPGSGPTQAYQWECSCGETNSSRLAKRHPSIKYMGTEFSHYTNKNECERNLDKHLRTHDTRHPHAHAHEEPGIDSDAFPDDDVRDDVQRIIPTHPGSPGHDPMNAAIASACVANRWMLFNSTELVFLQECILQRMGSGNSSTRLQIEQELERRDRNDQLRYVG